MEKITSNLKTRSRISFTAEIRRFFEERNVWHDWSTQGKDFKIQLDFDNYPYLLTDEIYNRKGKKSRFEEWELWYLLFCLSAAQNDMKQHLNSKIGDVRPENVFINAEGKIKTSNLLSWPGEKSGFNKAFDNEITYLAP